MHRVQCNATHCVLAEDHCHDRAETRPARRLPDRIVCDPEILGRKPTSKGAGISVALLNQLLWRGYTPDAIIGNYLHLTEEDAEACRRYGKEPREREYAEFVRKTPKQTSEAVADWRDRIECVPGRLGGKPVIVNTRLSVEFITDLLQGGSRTPADVVRDYPQIRADDVDACIRHKATGAKLSNFTWVDLNALMDAAELSKP